jgi:hypothetical protein
MTYDEDVLVCPDPKLHFDGPLLVIVDTDPGITSVRVSSIGLVYVNENHCWIDLDGLDPIALQCTSKVGGEAYSVHKEWGAMINAAIVKAAV